MGAALVQRDILFHLERLPGLIVLAGAVLRGIPAEVVEAWYVRRSAGTGANRHSLVQIVIRLFHHVSGIVHETDELFIDGAALRLYIGILGNRIEGNVPVCKDKIHPGEIRISGPDGGIAVQHGLLVVGGKRALRIGDQERDGELARHVDRIEHFAVRDRIALKPGERCNIQLLLRQPPGGLARFGRGPGPELEGVPIRLRRSANGDGGEYAVFIAIHDAGARRQHERRAGEFRPHSEQRHVAV